MFLLMSGLSAYLRIFLVLALAPAVILMVYVYRLDPLDKEPVNLLWSLILSGVCAGLIAGVQRAVHHCQRLPRGRGRGGGRQVLAHVPQDLG